MQPLGRRQEGAERITSVGESVAIGHPKRGHDK
jgi:hypothetical protein